MPEKQRILQAEQAAIKQRQEYNTKHAQYQQHVMNYSYLLQQHLEVSGPSESKDSSVQEFRKAIQNISWPVQHD